MKNMKRTVFTVLCILTMVAVMAISFADSATVSSKVSAPTVKVGETVTMTVSLKNTTVSSIGVTVTLPDGLEVVSGEWMKQGTIMNYDMSRNKGAFAPGSATEISGDVFKLTLKATAASKSKQDVQISVVGKNGVNEVFEETTTQSIQPICANHTFNNWTVAGDKHEHVCSACGHKESIAHTWDAGVVTQEPSCTAKGVKTFTCSTCKATKTEDIKMLDHTYGEWTKLNDNQHERKCSCGASDKANHNWNAGTVTKQPECDADGIKTFTCNNCNATKTEPVAKLPHTYTNSCDSDCNNCGAGRAAGHQFETKWSTNEQSHWHQCSVCTEENDKEPHTASDWIVDKPATDLAAGKQHKECVVCKMLLTEETIPAKGCKHTAGTTLSNKKDATCTAAGYTGDEVCKTCKTVLKKGTSIKALGHDIQLKNAKTATCKNDGYTGDEYCKVCKKTVKNGTVIPKGAHDFEVADVKEATCTEDGFTGNKTCKDCGATEDGTIIPKVEHEYVEGVCKNCEAQDPNYQKPTEPPTEPPTEKPTEPTEPTEPQPKQDNGWIWIVCGVIAAAGVAGAVVFIIKHKSKKPQE